MINIEITTIHDTKNDIYIKVNIYGHSTDTICHVVSQFYEFAINELKNCLTLQEKQHGYSTFTIKINETTVNDYEKLLIIGIINHFKHLANFYGKEQIKLEMREI